MEETWYCLYNCYGLQIAHGSENEIKNKRDEIIEQSKGQAGQDGRKLQFYCIFPKKEFVSLLSKLMQ